MSKELNREEKKKLAKELFLTAKHPQREIAKIVGASENTIGKWVKDGKWELLRANLTTTKENILSNWYLQLAEMNNNITNRKEGERFPTSSESDRMIKISSAIKKLETETGIAEITSVCIVYADPSTSNSDVKNNSFKVVVLMGRKGLNTYIIKAYCNHTSNYEFVEWFYDISSLVQGLTVQYWIENNTLQNPFYQQLFIPLFRDIGKRHGYMIPIRPDTRKKPDKFTRIEGTLEPPVRMGTLIFNEAEKENPNMQTVIGQFTSVSPTYKGAIDAPDAIEGGYYILDMNIMARAGTYRYQKRSSRRY